MKSKYAESSDDDSDREREQARAFKEQIAKEKADKLIRDAEHLKASVTRPSGKKDLLYVHQCDDAFFHYTAHVDKVLKEKIKKGEFMELEKLLPKQKFEKRSAETKLEIIDKDDGQSYIVPVSDRPNNNTISSFRRWDRAFRVYSSIYTRANPDGADELLQYVNSFETAAEPFAWDNVYAYDETFRNLMEEFPQRLWGIIYQQAWSLMLRNSAPNRASGTGYGNGKRQSQSFKR